MASDFPRKKHMQVINEPEQRFPVKAWVDGVELEDQARAQLLNVAKMPFIFKHVAVMPDAHAGIGCTVGSVIATKGAIMPACVGVDIGCFVGETRVPLLDGTQCSLFDLALRTEPFWVYSINSDFQIVPGRAKALKTRSNAELMKIVVSGGDEIVCTPDHKFMLNSGEWREAGDLLFNDSLMPIYRKWTTRDGYESVSSGKENSAQTHVMVWEHFNGGLPKGNVVHHRNHIHFDNRPENLQMMEVGEHSAYHRAVGKKFKNSDPLFQAARMAGIKRRCEDPEKRALMAKVGSANISRYMNESPEHFRDATSGNGKRGAPFLKKFNTSPRKCSDCGIEAKNPSALGWHKRREHSYNHKVIKIESLSYKADVYCLQVEEHHNFALAAGVFVHNCGMVAYQTSLRAEDLPDDLSSMRSDIERAVPHGRTDNGGKNDRGAWGEIPLAAQEDADVARLLRDFDSSILAFCGDKFASRWDHRAVLRQLGTCGSGNHFIEITLDESRNVWIMLHSGSRGVGNAIGTTFIERAKKNAKAYFIPLPDSDLAYFPEGSREFNEYVVSVGWAQDYAKLNRAPT